MVLGDVPPELRSRILELCLPSDLAALSRVHTSLRDIAEYTLYSRIQYHARPSMQIISSRVVRNGEDSRVSQEFKLREDRSLLHTFASNPRKASMVKKFYIKLETQENLAHHYACKTTHFILGEAAKALAKMPNLVDLRILHMPLKDSGLSSEGTRRISEVIRGDYFKLDTLYLEYPHFLERIVANQPHLRLLGIHSERCFKVPKELQLGLSRCRTIPTVFMLDVVYDWAGINMSPSFHHPGGALRVCREVATSLSNLSHGFFGEDGYHLSVSLLGTSTESTSLLGELMEAMAIHLRDYCSTEFTVFIHEKAIQNPWRFPEFVKSLALFDDVGTLSIVYLGDIDFKKWCQDLEFCMVKELGHAWPSLQVVTLLPPDADVLTMERESNWKATV